MLKNLDGFVELGTVGCYSGGGGIWISYIPIFVNGERIHVTYDSEAYYNDDNTPEFLVFDGNTMAVEREDYGDDEDNPGMFIHIEKGSPLFYLYKKLRRGIVRAIAGGIGFDGKPIAKGIKAMEDYYKEHPLITEKQIAEALCDFIAGEMDNHEPLYGKTFSLADCVGHDDDSVIVEYENGQTFQINIIEITE